MAPWYNSVAPEMRALELCVAQKYMSQVMVIFQIVFHVIPYCKELKTHKQARKHTHEQINPICLKTGNGSYLIYA